MAKTVYENGREKFCHYFSFYGFGQITRLIDKRLCVCGLCFGYGGPLIQCIFVKNVQVDKVFHFKVNTTYETHSLVLESSHLKFFFWYLLLKCSSTKIWYSTIRKHLRENSDTIMVIPEKKLDGYTTYAIYMWCNV